MHNATHNLQWASALVAELVGRGVNHVVIAPGSRSSPLTLAASRHPDADISVLTDERAAGFAALGYAKATGRPAAIITTSGTAVANLLPSVVEAAQANTPLVLLTADRPAELRGTGANQTIDQVHIFGSCSRWFVDVHPPGPTTDRQAAASLADQALRRAMSFPAGPVHLNLMFREPLVPEPEAPDTMPMEPEGSPPANPTPGEGVAPQLEDSLRALAEAQRGLVVVGSLPWSSVEGVRGLARVLGWPVFADITSGLRLGEGDDSRIVYFDALLQDTNAGSYPDTLLHLGGPFVSKHLAHYLKEAAPKRVLQASGPFAPVDPDGIVTDSLPVCAQGFCRAVIEHGVRTRGGTWLASWQAADGAAGQALDRWFAQQTEMGEPLLARLVSRMLPGHHALMLGNSMPIRDMNSFAATDGSAVPVVANRGASGIDGNIATAVGFAHGADRPVTLVLGDLALLHDLTSLQLAARSPQPVVVVVVNNNGGGIFHFLPIARHRKEFEPLFGTPHGLHFEHAAALFGLPYARPTSPAMLETAYGNAVESGTSALLEVVTDRQSNVKEHQRLLAAVRRARPAHNGDPR